MLMAANTVQKERKGVEASGHGITALRRRQWLAGASQQQAGRPDAAQLLQWLVDEKLAELPMPAGGQTLARWQALADVAAHDLSLAKLFEGHTDALAIMAELGQAAPTAGTTWGTWAAEAPGARVLIEASPDGGVRLKGRKAWCSGAQAVSHGLLTAWQAEGGDDSAGPWLVKVAMKQPGVLVSDGGWQSVGMAGSAALDVVFDGARAERVGHAGDYLRRPGFWQGGAGIAACWYGGTLTIAAALRQALASSSDPSKTPFRCAALGKVDMLLGQTAALLREAAEWIDAHPVEDASALALRVRLSAEACVHAVLDEAGRALGAAPFCMSESFARMAADLPVFVRQSHAERDHAALGERIAQSREEDLSWPL